MTVWFNSIIDGIELYIMIAPFSMLLFLMAALIRKRFSIYKFLFDQMFVAYLLVVVSLVFFPLPDAKTAADLEGFNINLIPGSFILDIFREKSVISVLQVVFNVCMMIPFGMYLNYCTIMDRKAVVAATLAFSLFIELGQLTGLFFIYNGSYRLCDIDDVVMNTLGGFAGYMAIAKVERYQEDTSKVPAWKLALVH